MSRKPLSKAEKSLFLVCTLAILPLAAVVFVASGRNAEPDWNIPPAAPRPKPNGTDFYVAAAKATVRFKPEVDPASDIHIPSGSDPLNSPYVLKNYSLARRSQWLKANAPAFALLDRGLRTPSMAPPYIAGRFSIGGSHLRQLARDISVRSRTFRMQNEPMRATMSSLDGMQMAQDSARGGALLPRLVGIAIMAISRSPLDDFDRTINSLNTREARTAARRLEKLLAQEPTPAQTLTEEKHESLLELRHLLATNNWRGSLAPNGLTSETPFDVWQRQTVSKRTVYANFIHRSDVGIANARLPFSQAQVAQLSGGSDVWSRLFVSPQRRFIQNDARTRTSNNMLLLRLALRAYIAQHKVAPPTLAALSPGILKSIPTDVYSDGKPLFYQPHGATYKLWSVGPDGKNDGGVPLSPRAGHSAKVPISNMMDNTGDFVAGLCR